MNAFVHVFNATVTKTSFWTRRSAVLVLMKFHSWVTYWPFVKVSSYTPFKVEAIVHVRIEPPKDKAGLERLRETVNHYEFHFVTNLSDGMRSSHNPTRYTSEWTWHSWFSTEFEELMQYRHLYQQTFFYPSKGYCDKDVFLNKEKDVFEPHYHVLDDVRPGLHLLFTWNKK